MSDLDRALRDLLTDEHLDLPARPDAVRIVHDGVRRRRRRRTIAVSTAMAATVGAAVAVALTVPAALTAGGPNHSTPVQPDERFEVAWVDKPAPKPWAPKALPPRLPSTNAAVCISDQLRVGRVVPTSGGDHNFYVIRLRNVSTAPCLLVGTPVRVAAQAADQPDVVATRGLALGSGGVGGDLKPGRLGYLTIETDHNCPARTKKYSSLSVTLPSATSFTLPLKLDVQCGLHTGGLGVQVPPPTTPPDSRAGLAAAIDVPRHAVVGQTFRYVVVLTNITSSPISMRHCPGYTEWINEGEAREATLTYGLNCSTLNQIAPGQQVRYEMRFDIPHDVDPGLADINWTMQFAGAMDGAAPMTIDPSRN